MRTIRYDGSKVCDGNLAHPSAPFGLCEFHLLSEKQAVSSSAPLKLQMRGHLGRASANVAPSILTPQGKTMDTSKDLRSARLHAQVDPLGAQLSLLRDREGRDLLWNGDPAYWSGRAPLLFPIVGTLAGGAYRLDDRTFALPRHGFARTRRFEVERAEAALAEFVLRADAETRKLYPFRFELRVRYVLSDATLTVLTTVSNRGSEPMPASFGHHPAFRWPLPYGQSRAAHRVEFEREETAPIKRLSAGGLMSNEPHPSPVRGRRLDLEDGLFVQDVLIFDAMASGSVIYGAGEGPRLKVAFPNTPYFGIWTKPGAPFVCLEPWHGISDPEGFAGDLFAKPGIFVLAPGASQAIEMSVTLLDGSS
jgi:galactose mutarotase-like enzyme